MKKILYISLLLISQTLSAQNLYEYIPESTSMLFSINISQLDKKSEGADYKQLLAPFIGKRSYYSNYSKLILINDLLESPDSFAINTQNSVFVYRTLIGKASGMMYLFNVNDAKKFESKIGKEIIVHESESDSASLTNELTFESFETTTHSHDRQREMPEFIKKNVNGGVLYLTEKQVIGIFGDVVYVFNIERFKEDVNSDYNDYAMETTYSYYGRESYMDSIYFDEVSAFRKFNDSLLYLKANAKGEKNYRELSTEFSNIDPDIISRAMARDKERKTKALEVKFNLLAATMENAIVKRSSHIGLDVNFMTLYKAQHDFFNYNKINNEFASILGFENDWGYYRRSKIDKEEAFKFNFLENTSSSYSIDFEKGRAVMNANSSMGSKLGKLMNEAYDSKQDKNLIKYIEGDNLLGYYSNAIDLKHTSELYMDIYLEVLNMMFKGEMKNVPVGVEMAWAFIDKEKLFGTIGNRTIIACTGFTDMKVNYISYDYNDDFESSEKVEERVEKQPKMVLATTIENKVYMKEIFDIFSKFTFVQKLNDRVLIIPSQGGFRTNVYFVMNKDVFIITNDMDLAINKPDGFPSSKQMVKSEQKFIMEHNMALRTFTDNVLNGIRNTYFTNGGSSKWYDPLYKNMGDITMHSNSMKNNTFSATAVVNMKDFSTNSLKVIIELMSVLKNVN